ncbi:MAG: hypothetical protein JNL01_00100 [Bdellovibrionales bacterium]|nr:hypothetical protein [Bdellovibrionales bacterium]
MHQAVFIWILLISPAALAQSPTPIVASPSPSPSPSPSLVPSPRSTEIAEIIMQGASASPVPSPGVSQAASGIAVAPNRSPLSLPGTYAGVRQGLVFPSQDLVIQYDIGFFIEREFQRAGRGTRVFGFGIQLGGQDLASGDALHQAWVSVDGRFELGNRFFIGGRLGPVFKSLTRTVNSALLGTFEDTTTTSHFRFGPTLTYEPIISWPGYWDGFLRSLVTYTKVGVEVSAFAQTGQPLLTGFQTFFYIRGRFWR